MAVFFRAIMREIASIVDKYTETTPIMEDKRLHNLERLLLRVSVIVEEADGRHIANKVMIHQLNLLRKEMYRGYFIADSLRSQGIEAKGSNVSHSFSLSKFNPAKRFFCSTADTHMEKDLQQVLDNLNNIVEDVNGLVMFLRNYPPLYRQPYSMHLLIGKCMFGRQMEMERIMDFLMQKEHPGKGSVPVLPIVGPKYVGKSTLVAHVYNDARVRNYFSQILVITGDDIKNENLATLKDRGVTIHQDNTLGKNEKLLAIIEFSGDVNEVTWNSLYSSSSVYCGEGSKMIITSRSNTIIKFGTTQALVLNFLPPEAYWYFFKILTFGTAHSNDHPRLESIGMEIARELTGSFIGANVTSSILQNHFSSQYWWRCLAHMRENIEINVSLFGEKTYDLIKKNKPAISHISDGEFVVWIKHRTCRAGENVPVITVEDVIGGSVKYEGEFDVLAWKSHVLPYNSYIVRCMIEKSQ
ncbi:hypothetical protein ACP70R_015175 [Stipagrostis hirtigluma subsp. patula]